MDNIHFRCSWISHSACLYSDNIYLLHILSYVFIILPEDEECIDSESDIVTISFGDTRTIQFKNKQTGLVEHFNMLHGNVS